MNWRILMNPAEVFYVQKRIFWIFWVFVNDEYDIPCDKQYRKSFTCLDKAHTFINKCEDTRRMVEVYRG